MSREWMGERASREGHLAWCKHRAMEYVDRGELTQAVASMAFDLGRHPDTVQSAMPALVMVGMLETMRGADAVRCWIRRFQ